MLDLISCTSCGKPIEKSREWHRFCSAACRARNHRLNNTTDKNSDAGSTDASAFRISETPETAEQAERANDEHRSIGWRQKPESNGSSVQSELERIWPDAEHLGWSYERIWNPDFWPHSPERPRGLASILQPGDVVADVAEDSITIITHRQQAQRFIKSTAAYLISPATRTLS
jgi:hypothetical protein